MKNLIKKTEQVGVASFAVTMGFCGLCFAWRQAVLLWEMPAWIQAVFGAAAVVSYVTIFYLYIMKMVFYPHAVKEEWEHPITCCFFGTFTVSTTLIAAVIGPYWRQGAAILWWVSIILILFFAWAVLTHWLLHRQRNQDVAPGWLLPVLGPITIPVAGNLLKEPGYHDIAVFCTSIGIVVSIPVVALLLGRLIIGKPLADGAQASVMVLMAPFGMGYLAYTQTFGNDIFSMVFICMGMFLFPPIVIRILHSLRSQSFHMGWWAMGFPFMAFTNGIMKLTLFYNVWWNQIMSSVLLGAGTMLILFLAGKTSGCIYRKLHADK